MGISEQFHLVSSPRYVCNKKNIRCTSKFYNKTQCPKSSLCLSYVLPPFGCLLDLAPGKATYCCSGASWFNHEGARGLRRPGLRTFRSLLLRQRGLVPAPRHRSGSHQTEFDFNLNRCGLKVHTNEKRSRRPQMRGILSSPVSVLQMGPETVRLRSPHSPLFFF